MKIIRTCELFLRSPVTEGRTLKRTSEHWYLRRKFN